MFHYLTGAEMFRNSSNKYDGQDGDLSTLGILKCGTNWKDLWLSFEVSFLNE